MGREAPHSTPPKSTRGRGHFDQNTKRSDVLPGEIYMILSFNFEATFSGAWTSKRQDFCGFDGERNSGRFAPAVPLPPTIT